jgi:hypothetical protein
VEWILGLSIVSTKLGCGILIACSGLLVAILGAGLFAVALWTNTFSFGWDFLLICLGLLVMLIGLLVCVFASVTETEK